LNKKFGKIFSFQTNPSVVTMQLTTKPHNFTLCKKERKEKGLSLKFRRSDSERIIKFRLTDLFIEKLKRFI
jgi:hypothetical protein